jgi:hypothetical protein
MSDGAIIDSDSEIKIMREKENQTSRTLRMN